jgi:hypothetical protein
VSPHQGIRVSSSTAGSPGPGIEELSGGYRFRGIPGWNPSAGVHGEPPAPQAAPVQEANEGRKSGRFRRFRELREAGVGVLEAARDPGVNVQPKTARSYERERKDMQREAAS